MRKRYKFSTVLTGLGVATTLALLGCNDYTTGQDQEPEGPLLVTKLVLFDNSRDMPVLTDTSAPADCKSVAPDDSSEIGQACNGPFTDRFNPKNHPVTTDSATMVNIPGIGETGGIQVIFNKVPFKVGNADLETVTKAPMAPPTKLETNQSAVRLECASACSGVPAGTIKAILTGTELSADPDGSVNGIPIPFGPAIRWQLDTDTDPLASLEPGASYKVVVDPGLADRNGNRVDLGARAQMLLSFTVGEKFRVLQAGLGDGNDSYVYAEPEQTYDVGEVPSNGLLVLHLNAPIDDSILKAGTVTATVGGKAITAGVTIGLADGMACDPANGRVLYVFPNNDAMAAKRSWGATAGETIEITLKGEDIHDLSQDKMHTLGKGNNKLAGNIKITAKNTGMPADMDYEGPTAADVFNGQCL